MPTPEPAALTHPAPAAVDPLVSTKALRKFLACLTARDLPVLIDLGPVVGSNVAYFGEQLGCKIFVTDAFADLDRFMQEGRMEQFGDFLVSKFTQETSSVDGVLCWDLFDYLDKASAQVVARELTRVLAPDGALLGFFGTAVSNDTRYAKYVITDTATLAPKVFDGTRSRQTVFLNRDRPEWVVYLMIIAILHRVPDRPLTTGPSWRRTPSALS